jgi:3',5'-cyclic AMP phosphodiesterase CpdA
LVYDRGVARRKIAGRWCGYLSDLPDVSLSCKLVRLCPILSKQSHILQDVMSQTATLLHVTDVHVASAGTPFNRDDHKVVIPGIEQDSREGLLGLLFGRLAERLTKGGQRLDGIIFSGDAQDRGRPGGHRLLLDLLLRHFGPLGITANSIVATPGNHDVPRASPPSSVERYEEFNSVWRDAGCVVPWLDGIDPTSGGTRSHAYVSPDRLWAIYPVNTSNWSHAAVTLPEPLASAWNGLPGLLAAGDADKESVLRGQLDSLARYDMARVSGHQLEVLRGIIDATPQPLIGRQLRIAVLHHHLRAPSLREELKPFADVSNLEQVRGFLRDRGIAVVIHGHKHENAAQYDHIYDQDGVGDHRALVIAGATFELGREADAARLITLSGMPNNPSVMIEPITLPRMGVDIQNCAPIVRRLWASSVVAGAPIIIQGSDLDEVYDRACDAAGSDAAGGTLIVHLDLPAAANGELPLPSHYPLPEPLVGEERCRWLSELVSWWQLERSALEHRMPFVHGSRLRRYGGKINQIERIIKLLEMKSSTRALAVLVDPFRDFTVDGMNEEFASFCLIEFKRRELAEGRRAVDAIAFYRAQEFVRWWPINIAEIRFLQVEICSALRFIPGRITTIAADARTHSRYPTQVAMPIIDRWLDQAPERLHILANAMVHCSVKDGAQHDAVRDWERTLSDLEATATDYNPDGIAIPIEGVRMLASYLKVIDDGTDPTLTDLTRALERLARENAQYEKSTRTKSEFDSWASGALESVNVLRRLTKNRLRTV